MPHSALAQGGAAAYNARMYEELAALIAEHQHIGIISHHRPDGDAIGSTIALGLALKAQGKVVRLFNLDGVPQRFAFLEGAELIETLPAAFPPELSLLICVDSGDLGRLGRVGEAFALQAPLLANIDHHATNKRYGAVNVVEGDAAACGCVLFQIFREFGWPVTLPMATALYAAVSTDTGSFQFDHPTTSGVMRMAAELIDMGVNVGETCRQLYQEVSPEAIRVQRDVLNNMGFLAGGAVSYYSMPAGRKEALGVDQEATKDLVDIIRVIRGVKVAVIFEDVGKGTIRVSLRSKDPRINVAAIATQFGGGGHAMAAGIPAHGTLDEVQQAVLAAILEALPTH